MEPEQVRSRVAVAVGLKLGVPNDKARIVGDAVLRVIQECGLITVPSSDLAKVNYLLASGMATNARLREALENITKVFATVCSDDEAMHQMNALAEAALAEPDAIVIEGELTKPIADA